MNKNQKVYVCGHEGLVGSALLQELKRRGYRSVLTRPFSELDLRNQSDVDRFFREERPDSVLLAAAHVGSITENNESPADFMTDNILIETNVIRAASANRAKNLIFFCSSNIYPSAIAYPKEEDIFQGKLNKSSEGYSLAKLFGLKLCEMYRRQYGLNYLSIIPCNLYGKHDRFIGDNAHVIPSLLRKFHIAKEKCLPSVTIWGSGKAMREFLYADDLADCCLSLLETDRDIGPYINVGSGQYLTIEELAYLTKRIVGYNGKILFDDKYPEGQAFRKMNLEKLHAFQWKAKKQIEEGLAETYRFYVNNIDHLR